MLKSMKTPKKPSDTSSVSNAKPKLVWSAKMSGILEKTVTMDALLRWEGVILEF